MYKIKRIIFLCSEEGVIVGAQSRIEEINECMELMRSHLPQFDLDGCKNVWIVKPGAKSRGRGTNFS